MCSIVLELDMRKITLIQSFSYFYTLELEGKWLCKGIMHEFILFSYDKVLCFLVRLFNPLLTAEGSWRRWVTAWESWKQKEINVCFLSFAMLNTAYHTSRNIASDLAGLVRKQVNVIPAWNPLFPFLCCNGLRVSAAPQKHTIRKRGNM